MTETDGQRWVPTWDDRTALDTVLKSVSPVCGRLNFLRSDGLYRDFDCPFSRSISDWETRIYARLGVVERLIRSPDRRREGQA